MLDLQIAVPDRSEIPASKVFDFDIAYDPLLKGDLHDGLLTLTKAAPEIFYTPRYGGHWVVQSHEAIFDVTHNHDIFSSNHGGRAMLPIGVDPPEHTDYRRVLLQAFSPKNVNAMMPLVREMTTELIDKVINRGSCEFVTEIAEPLPVIVFMKMLGLPLDQMAPLRKLIIDALEEGDPKEREGIFDRQLEIIDPVIHARQAEPQNDVISHILSADLGGRTATFDEVQRYMILLTNAGLDTVVNAMSFDALHFARDQELQAQVRADPSMIPDVIEELLRRYAVSSVARRVTRDIDYRGVPLKKGDRLHLLIPAANLDDSVYDEPARIVLRRKAPPVTFGTGVHRCLGSHLARLELRVLLAEWFARIPTFHVDPSDEPKMHAGLVYTVDRLPLVWDATDLKHA
ncbi:cytochrome P450 [Sphingomonas immobilis]|uniref:Cytochrome P450 n=1 Tax=Sphingomonas immobilis TaxID=3063997 RepID=A0ABT9A289_9SPHN|nr:cytochrome P450 [Sphingomonas sp. CA1-15]MDO7843925.1 cytochrome P450 [Sphingomonas sp. CA1-15]